MPLPHSLVAGQSCEQLVGVSPLSQLPLPQTGPVGQSPGHVVASSPVHLPSPQTDVTVHAVCAHCSSEAEMSFPEFWHVVAHDSASPVQVLKHDSTVKHAEFC